MTKWLLIKMEFLLCFILLVSLSQQQNSVMKAASSLALPSLALHFDFTLDFIFMLSDINGSGFRVLESHNYGIEIN